MNEVLTKEETERRRIERKATPDISRVKELRENHGITQKELADYLGVNKSNYYKREQGYVRFSLKEAKLLAIYFNTNIEALFFEPILNSI